MKFINIEEHIVADNIMDVISKNMNSNENPERMAFFFDRALVGGRLIQRDEGRLQHMDDSGITIQVLSYVNMGDNPAIPKAIRTLNIIKANNYLKEVVDLHPDRFAAFTILPVWDVEASVKELERTVKELGFKGAMVTGKFDDHFMDEKEFFPIFEKAVELDVPIYFHPSMPNKVIQDYYYTSPDGSWNNEVANEFGSAGFGWHLDIGIQVVRMILTGIFDKLPDLKLITGHWGEGIIAMLDRMDCMIPKEITGLKKNISEYYRENIYVTPSGIESEINLEAVTKYMGADHILWAEDYPYLRGDTNTSFLLNSSLTEEEKELISHKNAEKLLKL